ncbi:MAG: tRNA epoxyqueuosine(34) reductase QueG, partial [Ignavibacteria bacterium]|nr:tRNA epoxyqueuosine(34) reductase QueG [Ignavibacteria bacterium]
MQDLTESLTLTKKIKSLCKEAGFSAVGIAKPEIISDESEFFLQWLREGKNAEMKWLKTTFSKRINPFKLFNDVKSIISLAYIYNTPYQHKEDKNIPKISKYAWGNADYHRVVKKLLKKICNNLVSLVQDYFCKEIKTMHFVDTAPVMEKYWAVKSGIGSRGKNTLVINPSFGSFFFIGTIFINIELEYDKKIEDLCKDCNLCLKSCPTGALYSEFKLDASKCISYHTIENDGEIPNEINLNNWIFGCDICQNVCPYNNKQNLIYTNNKDFIPKERFFNKPKEYYLTITETEFNKEFKHTPLNRLKYHRWVRNL